MNSVYEEPSSVDARPPIEKRRLFRFAEFDDAAVARLGDLFAKASPFPHLIVDDCLALPAEAVVPMFPDERWPHWNRFTDSYQYQKRSCSNLEELPLLFQQMVHELSSPSFLALLENLTGIKALMPDPYLTGGGLHSSGPGGILAPHADFHSYGRLGLFRRLNVLVYLNREWRAEYGGCLEFFKKGETVPTASVVPEYGRMVVFATDDKSIHGFTKPVVGEDRWRQSLALYYYTAESTAEFKGDGVTYWQAHGRQVGLAKARLLAYKLMLHGSWALSKAAHQLNPNFNQAKRSGDSKK